MAPSPEPPASITLRVKVPHGSLPATAAANSSSDEFLLGAVNVTANVASIRRRIQHLVPSNPPPESQRLLYGGRALVDDEQNIADALNIRRDPAQTDYVVHLIVRGEGLNSGTGTAQQTARTTPQRSSTPNTAPQPHAHNANQNNIQAQQDPHQLHPHAQHMQQHQNVVRHIQMQMTGVAGNGQHVHHVQNFGGGMLPGGMPAHQLPMNAGVAGGAVPQQFANQFAAGGMAGPFFNNPNAAGGVQQQYYQNQQQAGVDGSGPEMFHHHAPNEAPSGQALQGGPPPQPSQPPSEGAGSGHSQQQETHAPGPAEAGSAHAATPGPLPTGPVGPVRAIRSTPAQRMSDMASVMQNSRRDVGDMRRTLDDLQTWPGMTPELSRRIQIMQQQVDQVEMDRWRSEDNIYRNYGITPPTRTRQPATPRSQAHQPQHGFGHPHFPQAQMQTPPSAATAQNVSCYLLSSPEGPRALLFSPQHGTYEGALPHSFQYPAFSPFTGLRPTPTTAVAQHPNAPAGAGAARPDPVEAAVHQEVQAAAEQQAQLQAQAAAEPLGPLQPLLGHVWLLMRILIFAYFLLGSNMGWQRPLILAGICLGFWILRMGFLGEGAPLRRWWDGLVQVPRQQQQQQPQGEQNAAGAAGAQRPQQQPQPNDAGARHQQNNHQQAPPAAAAARRPQIMPTPEQVAQRLLDEDAARRNARGNWLRQQIRPVERVVALFVASLWPGVGEAHVRAQERELRRLQEEETARRRAREEEAARLAEEENKRREGEGAEDAAKARSSAVEAGPGVSEGVEIRDRGSSSAAVAGEQGSSGAT